jgi:Reverse transcriptase (RNA-dependent DNA polymerase)
MIPADLESWRVSSGVTSLQDQVHTDKVSRGVPIGPHATHLLAELAFNSIDRALISEGLAFCRYVDDVHFFCKSEEDAQIALYKYAEILDDQQRLTLQDKKTEIVPADAYVTRASTMLLNQPLNDDEKEILTLIAKSAGGDYDNATLESLSEDEVEYFESERLEELFDLYLEHHPVPYSRLGWLLRRLSQVRVPGAIMDHDSRRAVDSDLPDQTQVRWCSRSFGSCRTDSR